MSLINDIISDLGEKRLWPFVALLAAAVVAVPYMISRGGEVEPTAVVQPAGVEREEGPSLVLARANTTGFERPPHVNDKRLDPFAARISKQALSEAAAKLNAGANDVIDGGSSTDSGGSSPGGSSNPPSDPEPNTPEPDTDPEVQTEQDDLLSILVTNPNDGTSEPKQMSDIRTLSPLTDPENPYLVYVGKTSDDKATFLVSADVTVSGDSDGTCAPSITDCRTLTLGIGETATFTSVTDQSKKEAVTVLDIETKEVPIDGTEETAVAARLERKARRAGAKALKSVLHDETVVKSLVRQKVKIRH